MQSKKRWLGIEPLDQRRLPAADLAESAADETAEVGAPAIAYGKEAVSDSLIALFTEDHISQQIVTTAEIGSPEARQSSEVSDELLDTLARDVVKTRAEGESVREPTDVNGDGMTSALDALILINEANANGMGKMDSRSPWFDVTGDDNFDATDVLAVINRCNADPQPVPETPVGSYEILSNGTNVWRDGGEIPAGNFVRTLDFALPFAFVQETERTDIAHYYNLAITGDWQAIESVFQYSDAGTGPRIPVSGPTFDVPAQGTPGLFTLMVVTKPDAIVGQSFSVEVQSARTADGNLIELRRDPINNNSHPWAAGPFEVTENPNKAPISVECGFDGRCLITTDREFQVMDIDYSYTGNATDGIAQVYVNGVLWSKGWARQTVPGHGKFQFSTQDFNGVEFPVGSTSIAIRVLGADTVILRGLQGWDKTGTLGGPFIDYELTPSIDSQH